MAKERTPGQTSVSISLSTSVLAKIDAKAEEIGLSRSAYLQLLAQHSLPDAPAPPKPLDLTAAVYDFLIIAIPALQEYETSLTSGAEPAPDAPAVEISPDIAKLWKFFVLEKDEILRHKYLRSKDLGYNIGLSRAIKEWLHMHRALWLAAQNLPLSTEH